MARSDRKTADLEQAWLGRYVRATFPTRYRRFIDLHNLEPDLAVRRAAGCCSPAEWRRLRTAHRVYQRRAAERGRQAGRQVVEQSTAGVRGAQRAVENTAMAMWRDACEAADIDAADALGAASVLLRQDDDLADRLREIIADIEARA